MPYRAEQPDLLIGTSVGNGQRVALTERAAHAPRTVFSHRGEKVKGHLDIKPGTIIATFDDAGRYTNSTNGTSHAAIYVGQDQNGIVVIDQWKHRELRVRADTGGTSKDHILQTFRKVS